MPRAMPLDRAQIRRAWTLYASAPSLSAVAARLGVRYKRLWDTLHRDNPERLHAMAATHGAASRRHVSQRGQKGATWVAHGQSTALAGASETLRAALLQRHPMRTLAQMSVAERAALQQRAEEVLTQGLGRARPYEQLGLGEG